MTGKTLVIFGARSGAGFELAATVRRSGIAVVAPIRPGADGSALRNLGCQVLEADATSPASVAAVFRGAPADAWVASTLGGRGGAALVDEVGNATVIDAAAAHGAARMLLISSLGAGDSRRYASERLLAVIGSVLLAKTRAEDHLRASGLAHVIIRPGGLVDGSATGTGELTEAMDVHGSISRGELAALALDCLIRVGRLGRTFAAVDSQHIPPPH